MQPSRQLYEQVSTLLAADTTLLASATAMHVHLVAATFVPSLDLAIGTLTFATFTGSTAINAGTGAQLVFYDPTTNLRVIEIKTPAGGWHWACTATPTPAQTIYGFALTDNADAVLLASALLPTPITISAAGQGIDILPMQLRFPLNSPN
jgi:hypothetical protein